jgi:hypothetical protein
VKWNKQSLFKEVKLDEPKQQLKNYEVEDVLDLNESQWVGMLGPSDGPLYFNRISKLKKGNPTSILIMFISDD